MEQALLVAGRILAAIVAAVAVVLLVVLIVGTTLVHAVATVPTTVAQTLAEEEFLAQAAQVAVKSVVAALPERLGIDQINIPTRLLRQIASGADLTAVAAQIIPEDWLSNKLVAVFRPPDIDEQAEDRQFIRATLLGPQAAQLARSVVGAARACTAEEERTLQDFRDPETRPATVINFICNPPAREDIDLNAIMQEIISTALASAADQIVANIPNPFESLSIPTPSIETPLGTLSLMGGSLHLSAGPIDLEYNLRRNAREPETSATPEPETSDSTLLLVGHLQQSATEEPTAEATQAATEGAESGDSGNLVSQVRSSLNETLVSLSSDLEALAASVNQMLWIVLGGLLVFTVIQVLFYVRTLRALGIWVGSVLTASGIVLLLYYSRLTSRAIFNPTVNENLSPQFAELRATLINVISSTLHSQLTNPFVISSLITLLVGIALLAYIFWASRRPTSVAT